MISIIISALNRALRIGDVLSSSARGKAKHEVIVVDDRRVFAAMGERGAQLTAGAAATNGDIIFFFFAGRMFPEGRLGAIKRSLLQDAALVGANFALLFDGQDKSSRWLDGFYAWIRSHGFYYGNSGIFVRCAVYDSLGDERPIPFMNDYDFVRRSEVVGSSSTGFFTFAYHPKCLPVSIIIRVSVLAPNPCCLIPNHIGDRRLCCVLRVSILGSVRHSGADGRECYHRNRRNRSGTRHRCPR